LPPSDKNERMFLILACLVSAGPLAIPRLMRSKAFGPTGKTVLLVCAIVQTILVVAIIVYFCIEGPGLMMKYLMPRSY